MPPLPRIGLPRCIHSTHPPPTRPSAGATHDWHVHTQAAVTGVYYATVPRTSAEISFDDGHEKLVFHPEPGDLIVFPSWLPHRVTATLFPSEQALHRAREHIASTRLESRVSFSFDLLGGVWGFAFGADADEPDSKE